MPTRFAVCLVFAPLVAAAADAPEQPLPFSHKTHSGALKLACRLCHTNPDPGATEGIPPSATCMQCHSSVKTGNPAIQKLAAYFHEQRPVPWVRVYEIPDYVNFSHRAHIKAGNTCEDCHGGVADKDATSREKDVSMTGCLLCHQAKNAGTGCTYCHDPQ